MPKNPLPNSSKITVAKARRILGMIAKNYSDDEIAEIVGILTEVSELSYRDYLTSQNDESTS